MAQSLDLTVVDVDKMLEVVVEVESRRYTPKLHGKGNTDFSVDARIVRSFDVIPFLNERLSLAKRVSFLKLDANGAVSYFSEMV